jgi:hypothetical protein
MKAIVLSLSLLFAAPVFAQSAPVQLGVATFLAPAPEFDSLGGLGLALDARLQLNWLQLGATLETSRQQQLFISGLATDPGSNLDVRLLGQARISESGPVSMSLRLRSGVARLSGPDTNATRLASELALLATLSLQDRWQLRFGPMIGFDLEVSPTREVADQAQLLLASIGYSPRPGWLLFGSAEGGGSLGFNGDNSKVLARATFGLRVSLDGAAIELF